MKLKEKMIFKLDNMLGKYQWFQRGKNDYVFRTIIFSVLGSFITLAFALFYGAYGIIFRSLWYGAFAGYYCILSIQKFFLLIVYGKIYKKYNKDTKKLSIEKQKIFLANGAIFIPLTIALTVVISFLISSQKPVISNEILAITTAAYAFYKITITIVNLFKAKRTQDKVVQSMKTINFVEAVVSIISLESTLITTFGEATKDMKYLIAISGLIACAGIIAIASYMIISSAKRIKLNQL